jgi:hypothetical protein
MLYSMVGADSDNKTNSKYFKRTYPSGTYFLEGINHFIIKY